MVRRRSAKPSTLVRVQYLPHMVFIVLTVSTSVCGTDSMGSNPINHPKCPYGGIGIRSGLRSHTIIGSTPITGTIFGKVNYYSYI